MSLAFERLTSRFSAPFAELLLELAAVGPGQQVLDLGTGTGLVALSAASRVGAGGSVIGVDVSRPMLDRASARSSVLGVHEVASFREMDACQLELPTASLDVVLSLFALLHVSDPGRALKEAHRVLKPGGRLAVAIGSRPTLLSLAALQSVLRWPAESLRRARGLELLAHQPLVGLVERHLPRAAPADHAAEGRHSPRPLRQLVEAAGFRIARHEWHGREDLVASAEEFWELQRTFCSPARVRLAQASPEAVERLRAEFLSTCGRTLSRGGRLVYRHAAAFVVAERPLVRRG